MSKKFIIEIEDCYEENMENLIKDSIYTGFSFGDIDIGEITVTELPKCVINHSPDK